MPYPTPPPELRPYSGPIPRTPQLRERRSSLIVVVSLVAGILIGCLGGAVVWYFAQKSADSDTAQVVELSGAEMETFIREHYAMLPQGYETTWERLSPQIHQDVGGYSEYAKFWMTVRSVELQSVTPRDSHSIAYTLIVTYNNGDVGTEDRWAEIRKLGDDLQIYRITTTRQSLAKGN